MCRLITLTAAQVFLVTGGASGLGLELVKILYAHNAKVYVAARSEQKASKAVSSIESSVPKSKGELVFHHLDLNDLTLVKQSANLFLSKEKRLDVLWNNAGVMAPPQGSKTKQNYEAQLGTNCLGPFLFTQILTPLLVETAKSAPRDSVRVVWLSSSAAETAAPKGGIVLTNLDYKKDKSAWYKYGVSKAGNIFYSNEFAKRHKADGVLSVVCARRRLSADI
jgi:NAD(P)-dependent dehydrogenase (short-subunit alcohol dehydrogenase family)